MRISRCVGPEDDANRSASSASCSSIMDKRDLGSSFEPNLGTASDIKVQAIILATVTSASLVAGALSLFWFHGMTVSFRQK